jgi:hypothetical protein
MPNVTSTPGDCFASIAKSKGFFNYLSVYSHADNAVMFPNPNQIEEGSTVKVPEKSMKAFDLPLDVEKKFKIVRKKTKLRLVVTDAAKTALAPSSCSLTVGSASVATPPGAQGLLELEIDPEETSGVLKLSFPALPAPPAPPPDPAAVNPPANPPLIRPSEFRDRAPKSQSDALEVVWNLKIGYLEPKDSIRGCLQRLNNLTIEAPIRKDENDKTRAFVKGYEAMRGAAKTGNISAIRADLAGFHDAP